jgi:thiol-disulfide isomerase/thioredoxin
MREVAEGAGDDINLLVESWMALGDLHIDAGDTQAAEEAFESLRGAVDHPQIRQQIGQMVDRRVADLELIGSAPTAFEVTGYDGKPLSLDQYKGKVTLIDFWATWCGPCVAELPNVIDAYTKYKDKGFDIIGISLDEDEVAFKDFIADREMTWRHFYDGKGWGNQVSKSYGINSIPATYLLDRDGNVFRVGVRGPALHAAIEKALAKPQG